MIDPGVHLRRRKDGVEVITIEDERIPKHMRGSKYAVAQTRFLPVRYVRSGRKGYIQKGTLESDFVVIGTASDPDKRWTRASRQATGPTAAAMELLRERDIYDKREKIMNGPLKDYALSPGAKAALDAAIHMVLAGI